MRLTGGGRMKFPGLTLGLLLAVALMAGCGNGTGQATTTAAAVETSTTEEAVTSRETTTTIEGMITLDPSEGIEFYFAGNDAQFELTGPDGTRIYFDVKLPRNLVTTPTEDDLLLITHFHSSPPNDWLEAFPGPTLVSTEGELTHGDIEVRSIAAQHNVNYLEMGSNHIIIIDWFGLRIVHFGGLGQRELTPEQLEAIGEVDVAITQFDHADESGINADNKYGFICMEQVQPKIVIPDMFTSLESALYAAEIWDTWFSEDAFVIGPGNLPDETTIFFLGEMAPTFQAAIANLT
jgi:hypothetical protein